MSIVTRRGDHGVTSLLFGKQVAKSHPRIAAVGAVDELNSAIGLARAGGASPAAVQLLADVQADLIALMGEVSVLPGDEGRYGQSGFARLTRAALERLDVAAARLEAGLGAPGEGWATPGACGGRAGAALDFARSVCRRAEREVWAIDPPPELPGAYLNRLADVLWLLARSEEKPSAGGAPPGGGAGGRDISTVS
jgi:cob(I)alamin adenosyltransferase